MNWISDRVLDGIADRSMDRISDRFMDRIADRFMDRVSIDKPRRSLRLLQAQRTRQPIQTQSA